MAISLTTPDLDGLHDALAALASWQRPGELQLHPGDIGWYWRRGASAAADAVRIWHVDGAVAAVGLLDGADLLRVTVARELRQDSALAAAMADDIGRPDRGVLPAGGASVEVPLGARLDGALADSGWASGEGWTLLERDLAAPVEEDEEASSGHPLRIVDVDGTDPVLVSAWAEVQRSAFAIPVAIEDRWRAMAAGDPFRDARCLLGFAGDAPAAGIIAWSAGEGRPGLIEPMGVHVEHRGRGHARAITVAAAAALRELGAASAQVGTESERVAAVATYRSAGFTSMPERFDRVRAA